MGVPLAVLPVHSPVNICGTGLRTRVDGRGHVERARDPLLPCDGARQDPVGRCGCPCTVGRAPDCRNAAALAARKLYQDDRRRATGDGPPGAGEGARRHLCRKAGAAEECDRPFHVRFHGCLQFGRTDVEG